VAVDPRRQAEDPLGEDIYFIDKTASSLMRLAMDSLAVELRGLETVAALTADQAAGARGMVCEPDGGDVYVLVDSEDTKQILRITPGGAVTVLYDFFDRGAGDAAGVQRDLAYDADLAQGRLYTIDTLNNNVLIYDIGEDILVEMFEDPLAQSTISTSGASGERVGLVVLK
jgi:DNA-binding beta-propeller fold protein YncE